MKRMKYKVLALTCILCLAVIGCCACKKKETVPDINLEEFLEANKTKNLLKHYDSFKDTFSCDGEVFYELYVDKELYYYDESDDYQMINGDDFQFIYEDGTYYGMLLTNGEEYNIWYDNIHLSDDTVEEEIMEAVDDGDVITLKTRLDTQKTEDSLKESEITYHSGDMLQCTYELDSKTYAVFKVSTVLMHEDGTSEDLGEMTTTYNVKRPDEAQKLLERSKPKTDFRTITIVLDPNTEDEKIFSRTVQKGDLVGFQLPEGYSLYIDENCTILAEETIDVNAHVLLFAKAD